MLDSLIPGAIHGALGPVQLAWLGDQLREPAPGGALVVLHHPVLPCGIPRATDSLLEDASALRDVLQGRPILGVLAGHSHVISAAPFASFLFDPGTVDGLRILDGAGFNRCTVREETLIVNPIIVAGA
jgi:3',5'-cyclic AMP phosphodiesterase CpdA